MKVRVIGDVHGKLNKFFVMCNEAESDIIQLGDLGFGSHYKELIEFANSFPYNIIIVGGNHDDYITILNHHDLPSNLTLVKDYGCLYNNRIGYVRGAYSIDKHERIEGVDWFAEEELSINKLTNASYYFEAIQPKIMITHTIPSSIVKLFIPNNRIKTRSQQGLQGVYDCFKPSLWLFGHFHHPHVIQDGETTFMCLSELQYIDLKL